MSRLYRLARKRQRGDILLESLIGILLMAIIGLGITYVASRAAVSQRDMKLENIVVSQMRNLLEQYGPQLCLASNSALLVVSIPTQTSTVSITKTCTDAQPMTVGATNLTGGVPQKNVALSTNSSDNNIFGSVISVGDDL